MRTDEYGILPELTSTACTGTTVEVQCYVGEESRAMRYGRWSNEQADHAAAAFAIGDEVRAVYHASSADNWAALRDVVNLLELALERLP